MRKKLLSLVLALVMCLGLTAPAFAASSDDYSANGYTDPAAENVEFSVAPIGVATIRWVSSVLDWGTGGTIEYTAYVFDQDCVVTRKDGLPLTDYMVTDFMTHINSIWTDDVAGVSADDAFPYVSCFSPETTSENFDSEWSPRMISKKSIDTVFPFVDEENEATGTVVEYRPLSAQPAVPTVGDFTDVKTGDYFAGPVQWAVEKEITVGTSATTFSPNDACTQGQILTFLWRAKGEPKPAGAVSGTQYYAAAAQWAGEQGLTDDFSAEAGCTRSMVVTYLWKLAGSPNAGTSDFTDVPAGADYAQAVAWAVEQGVTTGTSDTTFSPDGVCTRAQIVTFLYRGLAS